MEPATSLKGSSKPTDKRMVLPLEPLLPSKPEPGLRAEPFFQPPEKPQQQGSDEAKPAKVVSGGPDGFVNNKKAACEAEKQLWAAVEETTAEIEAKKGMESNEEKSEEDQKQEGVLGG